MTKDDRVTTTRSRGSSLPVVIVLVVALLAGVGARQLQDSVLAPYRPADYAASGKTLSQLSSYSLGLALGGLRGPLVMALWTTSERQKSDRQLDDFTTRIELIRQLQPEFDSVHLFQIWNLAYNISVQLANLPSKYDVIVDSLRYARDTARQRPESLNIESQIGQILFDKLGNSAEKRYFRPRMAADSRPRISVAFPRDQREAVESLVRGAGVSDTDYKIVVPLAPQLQAGLSIALDHEVSDAVLAALQSAGHATRQEPSRLGFDNALTPQFTLRPELADRERLVAIPPPRPNELPLRADEVWRPQDKGFEFLVRFEPFSEGISPFAFAYNYYKRSVALIRTRQQRHIQVAERVISSRVPMSLMFWGGEMMETGRLREAAAFDRKVEDFTDWYQLSLLTAGLSPVPTESTRPIRDAILAYRRAEQVMQASVEEFAAHFQRHPDDTVQINWMPNEMRTISALAVADRLYLQLMIAPADQRPALIEQTRAAYHQAQLLLYRQALAHYMRDIDAPSFLPRGMMRADIFLRNADGSWKLPDNGLRELFEFYYQTAAASPAEFAFTELSELNSHVQRCLARLNQLAAMR